MRAVTMTAVLAVMCASGCDEHGKGGGRDAGTDGPRIGGLDGGFFPDAGFPDAGLGGNAGFTTPTAPLSAWTPVGSNTYASAPLDLSCLHAPRNDAATTASVSVPITVQDFQTSNAVASATVSTPFGTATTNASGQATLTVPSGTRRFAVTLSAANSRQTLLPDQLVAGAQARTLQILSNSTAATLPALIGESATPGRAIEVGTITDCQGHLVAGAIATVSSMPGVAAHLVDADTFYFADSVDLPVEHQTAQMTSKDGLFMVIELPPANTAFVQVWGFRTSGELAAGTLREIAELQVVVAMDGALMTVHDPRATQ